MELEKRIAELLAQGIKIEFCKATKDDIRITATLLSYGCSVTINKNSNYFDAIRAVELGCKGAEGAY